MRLRPRRPEVSHVLNSMGGRSAAFLFLLARRRARLMYNYPDTTWGNIMVRFVTTLLAALAVTLATANAQSDLVKRGDYLVNGLLTCGNCHTPKGPTGDIKEKAFSGGLSFDEPPFKVTAPNITPDKETGIGNYTDAQLMTVLRKGIKANGIPVAMIMPSGFYEIMTDRDLNAVVAYLRTLKPVANKVPDPIYKMAQGHPIPPG